MCGFGLCLLRSFFRSTELKRQLMGEVHRACAIFLCGIRCLLEERYDRMTGVVDYEGSLRPGPLLGSERNDWFWLIRDTV